MKNRTARRLECNVPSHLSHDIMINGVGCWRWCCLNWCASAKYIGWYFLYCFLLPTSQFYQSLLLVDHLKMRKQDNKFDNYIKILISETCRQKMILFLICCSCVIENDVALLSTHAVTFSVGWISPTLINMGFRIKKWCTLLQIPHSVPTTLYY